MVGCRRVGCESFSYMAEVPHSVGNISPLLSGVALQGSCVAMEGEDVTQGIRSTTHTYLSLSVM